MEIKKRTINMRRWDYVGGATPYTAKFVNVEAVTYEDYKVVYDSIVYIKANITELPKDAKVYFDKTVTFPRRKFTSLYPENSISRTLEHADVLVIDEANIIRSFPYVHPETIVPFEIGKYRSTSEYAYTQRQVEPAIGPEEKFILFSQVSDILDRLEYLGKAIEMEKKIIDVNSLNVGTEEMTLSSVDRVSKMLASSDSEMINMGMRILTAYDYNKEKKRLAIILNENWSNWRRCAVKKPSVEVKTMLKKLETDYPSFQREDNMGQMEFWLKIYLEDPTDEIIGKAVNNLMNRNFRGLPKFKIVRDDTSDTD